MINSEQIKALRVDLEKAGGLEWLNMCADLEYCKNNPGHWLMSLYKTNVLAKMALMSIDMLAERDADKALIAEQAKRIAELEGALNLASASYAGERERADALQARTVKLPESFTKSMYGTPLYEHVDIVAMLAAAGITLVVGE